MIIYDTIIKYSIVGLFFLLSWVYFPHCNLEQSKLKGKIFHETAVIGRHHPQMQDWNKGSNSVKHTLAQEHEGRLLKAFTLPKLLDWQLLKTRWATPRFHLAIQCSVEDPKAGFYTSHCCRSQSQLRSSLQHAKEHHPCCSHFLFWERR